MVGNLLEYVYMGLLESHTLTSFDADLRNLRNSVLTMASLAQRNLENACRGLQERNSELCNEAIGEDDEVDELERQVDREGMELILRYSPVASDLRQVLRSMKVATDLERISDQAVNIAKRVRKLNKAPEVPITKTVQTIYEMAGALLRKSIRAFSEGDVDLAETVIDGDQELDRRHSQLLKEFTNLMEEDPENLRTYLHLTFVVRFLERVGDHAVNIAEDLVFIEEGNDIRHGNGPRR